MTPRKIRLNKENQTTLDLMNEILEEDIFLIENLTDLNCLHHAAAVTIAGEKEPKSTHSPREPDQNLKKQIEQTRKWIGRLTAKKKGDKLTRKLKKFLKSDTQEEKLVKLKMKLGALCKRKRTRQGTRARRSANRLFYNNQKTFYSKLQRGGKKMAITDPPTKEGIQEF